MQPALCALENIALIEPLHYINFVAMMEASDIVLTDSGGIQEEAPSLGKPVLVMRDTTERPEGVDAGTAKLVGADRSRIAHRRSVSRIAGIRRHPPKLFDAVPERCQIAVRGRDHRRGPAHQKVTGKREIPGIEHQMIAQMTGQMARHQPPARAFDHLGFPDLPVRLEVPI